MHYQLLFGMFRNGTFTRHQIILSCVNDSKNRKFMNKQTKKEVKKESNTQEILFTGREIMYNT